MKTTEEPIIVKQAFDASLEDVWKAITEVGQMKQWFFNPIESFESEVGFETSFEVQVEDKIFLHLWKVTEVIPMKKLGYEWKYGGYAGKGVSLFELSEEKRQVILTLTFFVLEDFAEDIPEFKRKSCLDGWNYFICKSLKNFLES